jgi:hypothetical protein
VAQVELEVAARVHGPAKLSGVCVIVATTSVDLRPPVRSNPAVRPGFTCFRGTLHRRIAPRQINHVPRGDP